MATLSYQVSYGDWSGTINLNYTAEYDRENNRTKITFQECSAVYSSRADYQTTTDTNITVSAGDNADSSGAVTLHTEGYGTGGSVTFTGTPSPASITVQHAAGAGEKTVSISAATTAAVRPYSGSSLVYAGGSGSASLTAATLYTLTLNKGSGTNLVVDLYSSPFREPFSGFSSGATIYEGEVLRVWGSASSSTAYENFVMNVSGVGNVSTGTTVPVNGNITVKTTAQVKSFLLTVDADEHTAVTVKRTSSPLKGAANGVLSNGATVYYHDVLAVSFAAASGYKVSTADINGTAISPDTQVSHTVSGPVTVTAAAKPLSNLFVDEGGTRRRVLLYIDDNGNRALYRAVFK